MLSNILRAVRRWWWLLALAVLIAAGSAYRSASHTPRYYRAGSTVMVGRVIQQSNPNPDAFTLLDRLTSFYANVATREPVLTAAAKSVSPPTTAGAIAPRVQARAISGTQFIEVTYLDLDPQRAAQITNAIVTELVKQSPTPDAALSKQQAQFTQNQLNDLQAKITDAQDRIKKLEAAIATGTSAAEIADARDNMKELQAQVDGWRTTYVSMLAQTEPSETNYLSVIEPAAIPSIPIASSRFLVIGVGTILGLALAFGGILVIEYLDDTLRRPLDIPTQTRIPLIATVPGARRNRARATAAFTAMRNAFLEQASATPLRLLVAGTRNHTGVTFTARGLADAFALAGHRVVLVDGNLVSPALHAMYEVPVEPGFAQVIKSASAVTKALRPAGADTPNLFIVPAGSVSGDDNVLASPGVPVALDEIARAAGADILLVDGGAISDRTHTSRLLARYLSETVLVVTGRTRARTVIALADTLTASGTRVVGLVFNGCSTRILRRNRPRTGRSATATNPVSKYFGFGASEESEYAGAPPRSAGALAMSQTDPPTSSSGSADMLAED